MKPAADTRHGTARISEIDLLRFIAALAVVFFHYAFRGYALGEKTVMPYLGLAPFGKYGYLGVDLFFMISGFVILMTAMDSSVRQFIVTRIVRLYPAFWFCCTLTFVTILLIGNGWYDATLRQYLINMTMLNGFVGVPSIDGVYWSLVIELKFYFLVFIVLLFGGMSRAQLLLWIWMALVILLEFLQIATLQGLLISNYAAYFIAGATLFLVWLYGMTVSRAVLLVLCWALALRKAVRYAQGLSEHYQTTMDVIVVCAIVSVFFAAMLLIAIHRTGLLGRTNWVALGALTYPLYLIHQNIGFMIFNYFYPKLSPHVIFWGTFAAMLLASYLVYSQVERRLAPRLKKSLGRAIDSLARAFSRSANHTRA